MTEHRLPTGVRPTHYAIHLTADPDQPEFFATVAIDIELTQATKAIVLHSDKLEIVAAIVVQEGRIEATTTVEGDRLTLNTSSKLKPGSATIHLRYKGAVRHDMAGLYLSKDGDRSCLATQCEATDARSIVPCWDEPAYKATWAWTITAPEHLTVLSNGALDSKEISGDHATHRFQPVGPMSSYLIACCIGHFAASDERIVNGTAFKVWAMSGQQQHGDAGNSMASRMLPWYESYFGQDYAFGKYDQIGVPSFAFGAMENAGLVLFRPSLLLMDEHNASWDDRRHVALVVAHEFAHMWFGNLVTMAWWDDLWLNEAFAEWIAHKCAAAMEPELDVWVPFRQRAAGALSTDALASTHAIYHPVKTPEEAQEMFDAITYGKGSAVMRMLEAYLGPDAFQKGLQSYMEEFRFANAQGQDLWRHLGAASSEDVTGIMGDWVKQAGHPTISCRWDGQLHIAQKRTKSSPTVADQPGQWRVPMVIRFEDDAGVHEHRHLLTDPTDAISLPVDGELQWLWANAEDGGFYRVALDDDLQSRALAHLDALSPAEQVALLRDAWMAVRADRQPVASFLQPFEALLGARDYEAVEFTTGVLRMLDSLLHGTPSLASFRAWAAKIIRPVWHEDRDETAPGRQRRAAYLRGLGIVADEVGVDAARGIAEMERGQGRVDAQLAGVAVSVEAMNGNEATLDVFLETYESRRSADASPQEVERYLYALASFRDPVCIERVLALLKSEGVAAQAEGPILRALLSSVVSGEAAWKHLQADWEHLEGRLGEAWLGIIVEACGELPVHLAEEMHVFWDARLEGRAGQSYLRATERLVERAELEGRVVPGLAAWANQL